jgi:hypothetical protein
VIISAVDVVVVVAVVDLSRRYLSPFWRSVVIRLSVDFKVSYSISIVGRFASLCLTITNHHLPPTFRSLC